MNSAGNPFHYLGFVWAGGLGELAARHQSAEDVACASGACMVMPCQLWDDLGGFAPEYFAYHEDTELSLRVWQRGLAVRFVPKAVVLHHYEFARNREKFFLLERNRWIVLLTLLSRRTLALILPALLVAEVGVLVVAVVQGWAMLKLRSWLWLIGNAGWIMARRRQLQQERRVSDRALAPLWSGNLEPVDFRIPKPLRSVGKVAGVYWTLVKRYV
jgi:GT2 family glycosyltransferase